MTSTISSTTPPTTTSTSNKPSAGAAASAAGTGVITSMGVGSGIDISTIISQLMQVEQMPLDTLKNQEASYNSQLSALGTLKGNLSDFQALAQTLGDPSKLNLTTATLSNTTVGTVTATNEAQQGQHTLQVTQLAQNQVIASKMVSDPNNVVGMGTMTISFGAYDSSNATFSTDAANAPLTINIGSANNSLFGMRDAINSAVDANGNKQTNVTASVINDGTGFRLLLSSNNSGAANGMKIATSDASGSSGLSQFAYDPAAAAAAATAKASADAAPNDTDLAAAAAAAAAVPGAATSMKVTQAAQDAKFTLDGVAITKSSNTVNDVLAGVTLTLQGTNLTNPTTLTIGTDATTLTKNVQALVDGYNKLMGQIDSLTSYDSTTNTAGVFNGQSSITSMKDTLRNLLNQTLGGSNKFQSLYDVGISFGALDSKGDYVAGSSGIMSLDTSKLSKAIQANPMAVANLFTSGTSVSPGSQVSVVSTSQMLTKPGDYAVNVISAATQGQVNSALASGLDFSGAGVTVDDTNDSFYISVDGTSAAPIKVAHQTYTSGADLATAMQTAISADGNLKLAGSSVVVGYDETSKQFSFTSSLYGSSSKIQVTTVDTGKNYFLASPDASTGVSNPIDFSHPVVVDPATNGNFSLTVGGITASLTLNKSIVYADNPKLGTSGGDDLAADMQAMIDGNSDFHSQLQAAGLTVSVNYDQDSKQLKFTAVDGGGNAQNVSFSQQTSHSFLNPTGGESMGADAVATIGGQYASAIGNILTGTGNAAGLIVKVGPGASGNVGTVSVTQGYAASLNSAISGMLSTKSASSMFQSMTDRINANIKRVQSDELSMQSRLDLIQQNFVAQFTAMDTIVGQLKNTSTYLTGQLANLPKWSS